MPQPQVKCGVERARARGAVWPARRGARPAQRRVEAKGGRRAGDWSLNEPMLLFRFSLTVTANKRRVHVRWRPGGHEYGMAKVPRRGGRDAGSPELDARAGQTHPRAGGEGSNNDGYHTLSKQASEPANRRHAPLSACTRWAGGPSPEIPTSRCVFSEFAARLGRGMLSHLARRHRSSRQLLGSCRTSILQQLAQRPGLVQ